MCVCVCVCTYGASATKAISVPRPTRVARKSVSHPQGTTALMAASLTGKREVVEVLQGKGAGIDLQNMKGEMALTWASQKGERKVVEMLLGKRARVSTCKTRRQNGADVGDSCMPSGGGRGAAGEGREHRPAHEEWLTALVCASENGYTAIAETL